MNVQLAMPQNVDMLGIRSMNSPLQSSVCLLSTQALTFCIERQLILVGLKGLESVIGCESLAGYVILRSVMWMLVSLKDVCGSESFSLWLFAQGKWL